ncbi:hypothetical protein WDW37_21310 [Bdellovibrionota bacterium FG-1]
MGLNPATRPGRFAVILISAFLLLSPFVGNAQPTSSCIFSSSADLEKELTEFRTEFMQLQKPSGFMDRAVAALSGCSRFIEQQISQRLATAQQTLPKVHFPLSDEDCEHWVALQDRTRAWIKNLRQIRKGGWSSKNPGVCRGLPLNAEYRYHCKTEPLSPLTSFQESELAQAEEAVAVFDDGSTSSTTNPLPPKTVPAVEKAKPQPKDPIAEMSRAIDARMTKPPNLEPNIPARVRTEVQLVQEARADLKNFKTNGKVPDHPAEFAIDAEVRGHNQRLAQDQAKGKRLKERFITQKEVAQFKKDWAQMVQKYGEFLKTVPGTPGKPASNDEKIGALGDLFFADYLRPYVIENSGIFQVIKKLGGNCHAKARSFYALVKQLGLEPDDGKKYGFFYVNGEHQELVVYSPPAPGQKVQKIWKPLRGKTSSTEDGTLFSEMFFYQAYLNKRGPVSQKTNEKFWIGGHHEGTPSRHPIDPKSMSWHSEFQSPIPPDDLNVPTPYSPPYGTESPPGKAIAEEDPARQKAPDEAEQDFDRPANYLPPSDPRRLIADPRTEGIQRRINLGFSWSYLDGKEGFVFDKKQDLVVYQSLSGKGKQEFLLKRYEERLQQLVESDPYKQMIRSLGNPLKIDRLSASQRTEIFQTLDVVRSMIVDFTDIRDLPLVASNKAAITQAWIEKYPQIKDYLQLGEAFGEAVKKDPKSLLRYMNQNEQVRKAIYKIGDDRIQGALNLNATGKNVISESALNFMAPVYDLLMDPKIVGIKEGTLLDPKKNLPPTQAQTRHPERKSPEAKPGMASPMKAEIQLEPQRYFQLIFVSLGNDSARRKTWTSEMSKSYLAFRGSDRIFDTTFFAVFSGMVNFDGGTPLTFLSPEKEPIPRHIAEVLLSIVDSELQDRSSEYPIFQFEARQWGGLEGYANYLRKELGATNPTSTPR